MWMFVIDQILHYILQRSACAVTALLYVSLTAFLSIGYCTNPVIYP